MENQEDGNYITISYSSVLAGIANQSWNSLLLSMAVTQNIFLNRVLLDTTIEFSYAIKRICHS